MTTTVSGPAAKEAAHLAGAALPEVKVWIVTCGAASGCLDEKGGQLRLCRAHDFQTSAHLMQGAGKGRAGSWESANIPGGAFEQRPAEG